MITNASNTSSIIFHSASSEISSRSPSWVYADANTSPDSSSGFKYNTYSRPNSSLSNVNKTSNTTDKYAIGGIIGVLIFQQIYNISMTIGLLPIMGITLPFISYGGSSLLSYMILLGIIFNVSNESLRFTNK